MKTDLKSIDTMISSIAKRGKVLREDCHTCLVAVLEHHMEHGDYTRLPMLLDAVRTSLGSSLSAAMIDWTTRFYTGLAYDDKNGEKKMAYFVHIPKVDKLIRDITAEEKIHIKGAPENQIFVGNARDLPFYSLEREVEQKPFDLAKAIEQLLKRAKAAQEANITKHAHNNVNAGQIKVLENLAKNIVDVKAEDLEPRQQQVAANDTARGRKPKAAAKAA